MALTDISNESSASAYEPEIPPIKTDVVLSALESQDGENSDKEEEIPLSAVGSPAYTVSSKPRPEVSSQQEAKVSSENGESAGGEADAMIRPPIPSEEPLKEIKAIWISYLDLDPMMKGKTKAQFTANIESAFDNVKNFGLNTVFVHVRPFGDALYKSEIFPWSYLITGTEGEDPGYDPLSIMVAEAKKRGLKIEAWINPYRVRAAGSSKALAASNRAKIWMDEGSDAVIQYEGVISYNPGSKDARELIIDGVRELVSNYGVDGVHIDDYFYPSKAEDFDKFTYNAYVKSGGRLTLENWRRENVAMLIKGLYAAVKETRGGVLFGVSPQSSLSNNYSAQYLDVERILSEKGYCDYICPQVYFGFDNETQPFMETIEAWDRLIKAEGIGLYAGLATYKIGVKDTWAGKGSEEWLQNGDLMRRMVEVSRGLVHYKGFAAYRYDSLFNPASAVKDQVDREARGLKEIIS